MMELLLDRLLVVFEALPDVVDTEDLFGDWSRVSMLEDPEACRAVGWIEGVADAYDLTALELLGLAGLPTDRATILASAKRLQE